MNFEYSQHWLLKRRNRRKDITEDLIEYCIMHSITFKDKKWPDVWNAIARVPPSGRTLKVVYRTKGKDIKILTAYWLE